MNLSDLEISEALALAIGWKPMRVAIIGDKCIADTEDQSRKKTDYGWVRGRIFDYRDWTIAGPIAERFDCFPIKTGEVWNSRFMRRGCGVSAHSPQKAIALAVIAGVKK